MEVPKIQKSSQEIPTRSLKRLMATRQGWEMPSWLLAADMAELKLMLSTKSFELNIPREGPLRGLYLWFL
jgi:hypothetical protein